MNLLLFHLVGVAKGHLTCVSGGEGIDSIYSSTTECFSDTDRTWSIVPKLSLDAPKIDMISVNLGMVACLIGGYSDDFVGESICATNNTGWTPTPFLATLRRSAITLYGKNWVGMAGGNNQATTSWSVASLTSFPTLASSPSVPSLSWTDGTSYPSPGMWWASPFSFNGTACVAGGFDYGTGNSSSVVSCAASDGVITKEWTQPLVLFKQGWGASYISTAELSCLVGGTNLNSAYFSQAQCINTTSSSSSSSKMALYPALNLPYNLAWAANVTLFGMQCITGGLNKTAGNSLPATGVLCLNSSFSSSSSSSSSAWVTLPPLNTTRYYHTSFVIQDAPTPHPSHAPTLSPTLAPTLAPSTGSPTVSPTTAPSTLMPTTLAPTTLMPTTLAPTTLMPTSSPTTRKPTSAPTTLMPTPAPTTLMPTISPTITGSPTASPTAPQVADIVFSFTDPSTISNRTEANALKLANQYISTLLVQLNITASHVAIKQAYFSDQGDLHVVVNIIGDDGVRNDVASGNGGSVLGARVSVTWPSLINLAAKLPVWVPIIIAVFILAFVVLLLFLSHRYNPKAKLLPLVNFISYFFSLFLQIWAAYTIHALQAQRTELRGYLIAYVIFLVAPILPNMAAISRLRGLFKSNAALAWYAENRRVAIAVACMAVVSNLRLLSLLYSGSFGFRSFSAPVEPLLHRLMQASSVLTVVIGEIPRSVIQVLVIIVANDSTASVSVALPLCFSLLLVFTTSMQTCYNFAYAQKDIEAIRKG